MNMYERKSNFVKHIVYNYVILHILMILRKVLKTVN